MEDNLLIIRAIDFKCRSFPVGWFCPVIPYHFMDPWMGVTQELMKMKLTKIIQETMGVCVAERDMTAFILVLKAT